MDIRRFIFSFILAPVLLFSLTGCNFGMGDSDSETPDSAIEEMTGIVKPLGVSIYQEGSHRLEENGALKVILQSSTYNLYNFEESEVKISGRVRDTAEGSQRIMTVTDLEVIEAADDRVKRTQSYVSDYHTFQFEYPPRWKVDGETSELVSFVSEDMAMEEVSEDDEEGSAESSSLVSLYVYKDTDSFSTWLKSLSFEGYSLDVETLIRLDSRNATRRIYRADEGDAQIISISLPMDKDVHHLLFDSRGTKDLQKDKGAFYDMIDSFSFSALLGQADAAMVEKDDDVMEEKDSKDEGDAMKEDVMEEKEEEEEDTSRVEEEDEDEGGTVISNPNITSDSVDNWHSKGYTIFDSSSLGFGIDVPKSFYYSGFSGVTGVIYRYGFTDFNTYRDSGDDINLGNAIITLDIISGSLSDVKKGASKKYGTRSGFEHSVSGGISIYLGRDDHTSFVLQGVSELRPIIEHMAASIRLL